MPAVEEIAAEKERLYESSALRDDLNDAEATVLLAWGEKQVDRLAEEFPEEFEKKARFMRQLLKGINRFVGQREFNEMEGQAQYMSKILMYLEPLGWADVRSDELFAALPEDKADMAGNLSALLAVLSPESATEEVPSGIPSPETATEEVPPGIPSPESDMPDTVTGIVGETIENDVTELENSNPHSITQTDDNNFMGVEADYGEEETE